MFHSARIKLTTWYLVIIMLISISFSIVVYRVSTSELDRVERVQRMRIERQIPDRFRILPLPSNGNDNFRLFFLDPNLVAEVKRRLALLLTLINFGILGASALAGYFLAGRTLNPIKKMVDEQNRFVTDASHELRTPLTSLKTEIEVNLRDDKLTVDSARKLLESNLEEVNKLQTLTDSLIKLIQSQEIGSNFNVEEISLSAIIGDAEKRISHLAKNKQIHIKNTVAEEKIEGNKLSLTELFVILLDNAVKYSSRSTEVTVTSEKTTDAVSVRVSDHGTGIEEKDIPHLFDRFYRADKSRTKTDVAGYGLGLSIARQIVEKHSGTIEVQSKINEGTTFIIRLPLKYSPKII